MTDSQSHVGSRLWQGARALGRAALNFVYPPTCPRCEIELTEAGESSGGAAIVPAVPVFCSACRDSLTPRIEHSCTRCAAPVGPFLDTRNGCIHCKTDRFVFERVIRLGVYDKELQAACRQAKQPGGERISAALAGLLWEQQHEAFNEADVDVVVAVPHHWMQRIARPHNPAAVIAQTLAGRLKVPYEAHILAKSRRTPAQARLHSTERRKNLRNAFRTWGAASLAGRAVLLVDDVLTTGTTANEASKTLRNAGAARIVAAVIARGLGNR